MDSTIFTYKEAFKRNIGWITSEEQEILKNSIVAIGGLGGVGGDHAITLARMGFQNFHIADLDEFDYSNFNRQDGANIHTVGKSKINVIQKTLLSINPNIKINAFDKGIQAENIDKFLEGVDVYVDSLDIFAMDIRRAVFQACHKRNIPALTTAPLGMGAAFKAFIPGKGMSFDEYFGMKSPSSQQLKAIQNNPVEQYMLTLEHYIDNIIRFISGVAPSLQQRHYLIDKTSINFFTKDLPSTKMGISLTAGVMGTNVLKILLKRGHIIHAPKGMHFDAYRNTCIKTHMIGGHKNPKSIFIRHYIHKHLGIKEKMQWVRQQLQEESKKGALKDHYTEEDMIEILKDYKKR